MRRENPGGDALGSLLLIGGFGAIAYYLYSQGFFSSFLGTPAAGISSSWNESGDRTASSYRNANGYSSGVYLGGAFLGSNVCRAADSGTGGHVVQACPIRHSLARAVRLPAGICGKLYCHCTGVASCDYCRGGSNAARTAPGQANAALNLYLQNALSVPTVLVPALCPWRHTMSTIGTLSIARLPASLRGRSLRTIQQWFRSRITGRGPLLY